MVGLGRQRRVKPAAPAATSAQSLGQPPLGLRQARRNHQKDVWTEGTQVPRTVERVLRSRPLRISCQAGPFPHFRTTAASGKEEEHVEDKTGVADKQRSHGILGAYGYDLILLGTVGVGRSICRCSSNQRPRAKCRKPLEVSCSTCFGLERCLIDPFW